LFYNNGEKSSATPGTKKWRMVTFPKMNAAIAMPGGERFIVNKIKLLYFNENNARDATEHLFTRSCLSSAITQWTRHAENRDVAQYVTPEDDLMRGMETFVLGKINDCQKDSDEESNIYEKVTIEGAMDEFSLNVIATRKLFNRLKPTMTEEERTKAVEKITESLIELSTATVVHFTSDDQSEPTQFVPIPLPRD